MLSHAAIEPGQTITADLPGERIRVSVTEVLRDGLILARIPTAPMGKNHSHKINDIVPFERHQGALGDEWKAVDLSQKRQDEDAAKFREEQRAIGEKAAEMQAKRKPHPVPKEQA